MTAEAERQQRLLAAILAPQPHEAPTRGLATYRANAVALADRALGAACPTVAAMLGPDDLHQLAREFIRAHPPERGDIGEWGDDLPEFIAAHTGLTEWPWLADCARLDLAVHRAERAADEAFDASTLALLGEAEPDDLFIVPLAGTAVIDSRWPIVTIHAAHHGGAGLDTARAALADGVAEPALVRRAGLRAVVQSLEPSAAGFWQALLACVALGPALAQAGPSFDFRAWLADVVRHGAVKEVCRRADR